MSAEYQVLLLDPSKKYPTMIGEVLFESDFMHEVCEEMHRINDATGQDICIYQPRTRGFRGYIQAVKRDSKGRFI
jgi:hypothetical protein